MVSSGYLGFFKKKILRDFPLFAVFYQVTVKVVHFLYLWDQFVTVAEESSQFGSLRITTEFFSFNLFLVVGDLSYIVLLVEK